MKEKQLPKTAALSGVKDGLSNPVFATQNKSGFQAALLFLSLRFSVIFIDILIVYAIHGSQN